MTDTDFPFAPLVCRFESLNLKQLQKLAAAMSSQLSAPVVVGLVGTLGAGKTTFVQALSRAANIDASEVTSPTFTLLQSHKGDFTIHHLDTYRIQDEDEFLQLGVEELMDDSSAWTIIEWADRMPSVMPAETVWIRFQLSDVDEHRHVTVYCSDDAIRPALDRIAQSMASSP